jgi:hypothetical protein
MTRLSRLVLGAALVSGAAACSGGPTAPAPAPNTLTPQAAPLLDTTPTCRNGWDVENGRAC